MVIIDIWKQVAINDLKRYSYLENSIIGMREEIEDINTALAGSAYNMSSTSVQGGGAKLEDKYLQAIVRKNILESQMYMNEKEFLRTKDALNRMSADDRKLLGYAYINRTSNYIRLVMETFNVERSQAYRNIENALQEYCRIRYGV